MKQFLEHFPDLIQAVCEVHRVLKPGGRFEVIVPHVRSVNAHTIGHNQFFSYSTFEQLSNANEWFSKAYGVRFSTTTYRVRILNLHGIKWTPFDVVASRWPLLWEKLSFSLLAPTEIHWTGVAVK